MGESIVFWIHLLAAATWVGSQVFMFVAVVPALRALGTRPPATERCSC